MSGPRYDLVPRIGEALDPPPVQPAPPVQPVVGMPGSQRPYIQKAVAPTLRDRRWAMRNRAHLGESHSDLTGGGRLARLETALDTLTLALIAAIVVLLVSLL